MQCKSSPKTFHAILTTHKGGTKPLLIPLKILKSYTAHALKEDYRDLAYHVEQLLFPKDVFKYREILFT